MCRQDVRQVPQTSNSDYTPKIQLFITSLRLIVIVWNEITSSVISLSRFHAFVTKSIH